MPARYDVAIVGAGAAGIAASRRLAGQGRSVVVLEASGRVGGRAWTQTIDGVPLDMGCGWLHSADRNPLTRLAEANGFTVDRTPTAWREQYRDLGFPPDEQRAAHAAWLALHERLEHHPPASDRASDALEAGDPWNAYADALSGYINGAELSRVSVADYLAYDRAASDANWRVREGYGSLIAASLPPVALHLATPVDAIDHDGECVRLATRAGIVEAEAAIVTVSTAVLASGAIDVRPAIDDHMHAAANLPLGLADKLFLAIADDAGLEPDTHLIGNPRSAATGSYYLRPFGHSVIECFLGGAGASQLESEGLAGAFAFAADELAALFGTRIRGRLKLVAGSAWGRTAGIGGSYSHALPGHARSRAALASPVGTRLFFAGEATHATDFSTAHGAWQSGLLAADQLSSILRSSSGDTGDFRQSGSPEG